MTKFIEEFFSGNIDPQPRSVQQTKAVAKQMDRAARMDNIRSTATETVNTDLICI